LVEDSVFVIFDVFQKLKVLRDFKRLKLEFNQQKPLSSNKVEVRSIYSLKNTALKRPHSNEPSTRICYLWNNF
jgi:hypothetical protein